MGAAALGRHSDGQFPWNPELLNEADKCLTEVVERLRFGAALAVSADTRTKLGMRTPHPVLVALDDDRHGYGGGAGLCHGPTITRPPRATRALRPRTPTIAGLDGDDLVGVVTPQHGPGQRSGLSRASRNQSVIASRSRTPCTA